MDCGTYDTRSGGGARNDEGESDALDLVGGDRPFDSSATEWLVGQAIRYLNAGDEEGELAYARALDLLRHRRESVDAVVALARGAASYDMSLKWNLLHLLGALENPAAAAFLVQAATEGLAPQNGGGPRAGELLIRTMAVEALARIARRHPEVSEHFVRIVAARPVRPILIEAVLAAGELGLRERIRDLVPADDQWIFEIRKGRLEELEFETPRGFNA